MSAIAESSLENPARHILVDADACPTAVRLTIEQICRRHAFSLTFYADVNHELNPQYGRVICVEQGHDSVDLILIHAVCPGDIVVTQDYGLAALVLARRGQCMHPNGLIYHAGNIDLLLMERHLSAKARRAGERVGHARKRTQRQDGKFIDGFLMLLAGPTGQPGQTQKFPVVCDHMTYNEP